MAESNAVPEGTGQALFQFVRHWSRRWNGPADRKEAERGRDVLVAEAVYALRDCGEVTVNDVAAELAIDQSGASRMLSHAVEHGLLSTSASLTDARRRTVTLTDAGRDFLAAAHQWQDSVFAALTEAWTLEERNQFHRAMTRLLDRSADLSHERYQ